MDETMSNVTWFNSTTSTSDGNTILFSPMYNDSDWLPYVIPKYKPTWHINLGYKTQIKHMWD